MVVGRGQAGFIGNGIRRTLNKQLVNNPFETEALGRSTGNSQAFKRQGLHWLQTEPRVLYNKIYRVVLGNQCFCTL